MAVRFYRFFNYGESHVVEIDWDSARVEEKIDGSLISVFWYDGEWRIATNGMIDAKDATLPLAESTHYRTFYDLAKSALMKQNFPLDDNHFQKGYTYTFEVVSPFNRVVVPYKEIEIYFIGLRNNETLEEELPIYPKYNNPILLRPKSWSFNSLSDVVKMAEKLPFSQEGYVVVDKNWNRVKVKSPAYLAIHNMKGEGVISESRVLDLIKTGEDGEFLSYFPEYTDVFNDLKLKYTYFVGRVKTNIKRVFESGMEFKTRKGFALFVMDNCILPAIMFQILDKKIDKNNFNEYIKDMDSKKLLNYFKE